MDIKGAENLSPQELAMEIQRGARVIEFSWCVSLVIVTMRRSSMVLVRPEESTFTAALPYLLLSAVAGWWGFPFGLIFTPIAIIQNLMGGTDHTARFQGMLPRPQAQPMYGQPMYGQPMPAPPMQAQPVYSPPPGSTLVRVHAPNGTTYPATPLGQDGNLVRVRFLDGREEWVPAASVHRQ